MRDYSEKRDYHRMRLESEVEVTDASGTRTKGICRDLSGSGMKVVVDRMFDKGMELNVLIPPADEQFPPFEASCTVLRCETDGDKVLLGLSIRKVRR